MDEFGKLRSDLSSKDGDERSLAAKKLAEYGKKAVPFLVKALDDEYWVVRVDAAWSLGEIGDKSCLPRLFGMLENDIWEVQLGIIEVLADMGEKSALPLLEKTYEENFHYEQYAGHEKTEAIALFEAAEKAIKKIKSS